MSDRKLEALEAGQFTSGEIELSLREATAADLPLLNQLYAEMDGEELLEAEAIATIWEQMQQLPHYNVYLAEQAGQVVGTFTLLVMPTMMHRGFHRSALLDSVTVRPALRGQGLGTVMMQVALDLAREAGCYKVMLSSNLKRKRAHDFYRSLGFEQHGWSFSLRL